MPRSCSSRSNQGLSRACLVFLTRLAGLQTSKRCSAVTDVLKAAVALDAAASVITPPVDAFGSPSGLALSQSFQLARDACAAISDLYTFGQKNLSKNLQNQSQQRTCIRAALKAILALLPLHVRPGDEASQELLHKVSMDEVIRGLWMLILEPCMDGFKYRHLASTPTEAHPILQDMLLYIAVLDRYHTLLCEYHLDILTASKSPSPAEMYEAPGIAAWSKMKYSSRTLSASFLSLADSAISLAVHMMGGKPPRGLYLQFQGMDLWSADKAVATSFQAGKASIPGAWHSPLDLIKRALNLIIPQASNQWASYTSNDSLVLLIHSLCLAVTGVWSALQEESKQAGQQGAQLKQELTPVFLQSLVHTLSYTYGCCVDDENLVKFKEFIPMTMTSLADLLEMCFDCSGITSAPQAKRPRVVVRACRGQQEGSGGEAQQSPMPGGKGQGRTRTFPSGSAGSASAAGVPGNEKASSTEAATELLGSASRTAGVDGPAGTKHVSPALQTAASSASGHSTQNRDVPSRAASAPAVAGAPIGSEADTQPHIPVAGASSTSCGVGIYQQQQQQQAAGSDSHQHGHQQEGSLRQQQQEEWLGACDASAWALYRIVHTAVFLPSHTASGELGCSDIMSLSTSDDPDERLTSLYWVPFQAAVVALSLGKQLPPEALAAGVPGSVAFAASAACTALVQGRCLTSDTWSEKSETAALEVGPYCLEVLEYLLPAVQALRWQFTNSRQSSAGTQPAAAASSASSEQQTSAAGSSSSKGSDASNSNTSELYSKGQLQITLLLLIAAMHLPQALVGHALNNGAICDIKEWAPHLVKLWFEALSLLHDLVHDQKWRSAAKEHQPLLLLQATAAGVLAVRGLLGVRTPYTQHNHSNSILMLQHVVQGTIDGQLPLVSYSRYFWVVHMALLSDSKVVGSSCSPQVRWSTHDQYHQQWLTSNMVGSLGDLIHMVWYAFRVISSYTSHLRRAQDSARSAATGASATSRFEQTTASGSEAVDSKDDRTGKALEGMAHGHEQSDTNSVQCQALKVEAREAVNSVPLLVACTLQLPTFSRLPGCVWKGAPLIARIASDKHTCTMFQVDILLVELMTLRVLSMALALERGLPEEFFPPPARPMDRLKQLLGGGGYQGTLSESGPTLSSTPPPPAQTTTANAVAPEASETGASGCSSPASSPVEGPARSPSDDFLLHHAAILLRTRPHLGPHVTYAFGRYITHLQDPRVCGDCGNLLKVPEEVARHAESEEHKQYLDWMVPQLTAVLEDMVTQQEQLWQQAGLMPWAHPAGPARV